MKCENLYHEFKKYEGQPVEIHTSDCKIIRGIDLAAYDDAVRLLDRCGRTIFIPYAHIDAVVEPMMRIHCCEHKRCCEERFPFDDCECREDHRDRKEDRFDRKEDRCDEDEREGKFRYRD